ncbi:hypothetical protein [uncultured Pseudoalteromonas sp.]|uniref:hypothetical protein n=1 Tax=uncultured Pseudoalteromonas sp. TaxID=114053 RepID=UPI002595E56F|nr:hypothetical protein [uncultured Pseudoalteromonas sp.]
MPLPNLLDYESPREYRQHYERNFCRGVIVTADNIRIYFKPQKFGHAFYQNSQRRSGPKDEFAPERAMRMDWIKHTLEHPDAELYFGWNKDDKCIDEARRVSVVYEDFVVIVELSLSKQGVLKGNFVTCYLADRSIDKIKDGPRWEKEKCLEKLKK